MKILVAGDFCQRYRVNEKILKHDYDSLYNGVISTIRQADFSIVNFEFPVVINKDRTAPISKCGPNLGGTKESIEAIGYAGFNVCTLANNHILDQGESCCLDTIKLLQEAGINTVGAGKNLKEASGVLFLRKDDLTVAIINCCEHEFTIATDSSAGANPLNIVQQYYQIKEARTKADYVIVIVHGGHEHYQYPSPRMKEAYRFFIDAGADVVINHHQHCFSGYEEYKGSPIFYGLGNFMFDDPNKRNCIWNDGYLVMLSISSEGINYEILPYEQCNQKPTIELLSPDDSTAFFERLSEINRVISDDSLLKQHHESWMDNTKSGYEIQFTPWNGRITRGLFRRGLLPSFVPQEKKQILINFIECESHHDKMMYVLKNLSY